MGDKSPAFRLYAADFMADEKVRLMDYEAIGVYMMLLCNAWVEGSIPADPSEIARLLRIPSRSFGNIWKQVQSCWAPGEDGRLIQPRLEVERQKQRDNSERLRNVGSGGASARWGTGDAKAANLTRSERLAEARKKGKHTTAEWKRLVDICGNRCVRCSIKVGDLDGGVLTRDHIVPIYQGGSDGIENLQPLCRECNARKGPESVDYRPDGWQDAFETPSTRQARTPARTPAKRLADDKLARTRFSFTLSSSRDTDTPSGVSAEPLTPPVMPSGLPDTLPDDIDALKRVAIPFLAAFANVTSRDAQAKHGGAYVTALGVFRSRSATTAETWSAFCDAWLAREGKPLFGELAKNAIAFLPAFHRRPVRETVVPDAQREAAEAWSA